MANTKSNPKSVSKSPTKPADKSAPAPKKSGRLAKKTIVPTFDIAVTLSGDPGLLSHRLHDDGHMAVILATGQKVTFSPDHVDIAREQAAK